MWKFWFIVSKFYLFYNREITFLINQYWIRIGPCSSLSHHHTIEFCVNSAMMRQCYDDDAMMMKRWFGCAMMMMVFIAHYAIDYTAHAPLERKMASGSEWMKELYIRNWPYSVVKLNFLIIYVLLVSHMNI